MNEIIENPMGKAVVLSETAGARQTQTRELAETQAKYMMAQQFPRNVVAATDRILNAFTRTGLAEKSQYQFARGGTDILGPSIRAAEAIAQQWGNMEQGWRELSRALMPDGVAYSEVEAYCADLESRSFKRLQFIVKHWRDTKSGGYKIKDERDIYELVANQSQRRVRACILAMIPSDVIDAAMDQAAVTLKSKADTSPDAMARMLEKFAVMGVLREHIEKRIQRRIEAIQPAQVIALRRIYQSLADDMSAAADWFDLDGVQSTGVAPKTLPACSDADFEQRLPLWESNIAKGKSAEDVIAFAQTKYALTDAQIAAIKALAAQPTSAKTYAEVADAICNANDSEELMKATQLIESVKNKLQRDELIVLANQRDESFGKGQS
jgi:hypothetical protein